MKVLIFGSRDFKNEKRMFRVLDGLHNAFHFSVVIEGEADGADKLAKKWAKRNGVEVDPYPADWDDITVPGAVVKTRRDGTKYNKAAGAMRNRQMHAEGQPDLGIAFSNDIWNSRGTMDMLTVLTDEHVPVMLFNISEDEL